MNLLTDPFIPIQLGGSIKKISLQAILCGEQTGDLCLPRDDMELACLQLFAAITQVCFTPENKKALLLRLKQSLTREEYQSGIAGKESWFDLNHPETPFMQTRGVQAKEATSLDKLMAGVADGTNKPFVNPVGLVQGLCGGCVAIALFNTANNCPSLGGGFKGSLRGSTPITQLIKGPDLRQTIWLNVLHQETLNKVMPWYQDTLDQVPNYIDPVKAGDNLFACQIGLTRGLLWQPAHFELLPANKQARCSLCGEASLLCTAFNKAKFNYTVTSVWPHPLSARTFKVVKGKREEKFPSFTTRAPGWTHLSRLVVAMTSDKEGQTPAPVLEQARSIVKSDRLQFVVGGYQNNQATVLERRHEQFSLADGWDSHGATIHNLVRDGLEYKKALRKALYLFASGIKDKIQGTGVNLCELGESLYFQNTESRFQSVFSDIRFQQPRNTIDALHQYLGQTVTCLFDQLTQPYRQEPKMIKALALARRSLNKSLAALKPEVVEALNNE